MAEEKRMGTGRGPSNVKDDKGCFTCALCLDTPVVGRCVVCKARVCMICYVAEQRVCVDHDIFGPPTPCGMDRERARAHSGVGVG